MTPDEFRETMNTHLLVYFPDTADWAKELPAETKAKWASLFAGVDVRDLRSAIEQIVSGQVDMPRRELIGTALHAASRRNQYLREQREERREESDAARARRRSSGPGGIAGTMAAAGLLDVYQLQRRMIERLSDEHQFGRWSAERAYIVQCVCAATAHWFGQGTSVNEMDESISFEDLETLAFSVGRVSGPMKSLEQIESKIQRGNR